MDESRAEWRDGIVRRAVAAEYSECSSRVIQAIVGLGPECRQYGDDSPFRDVWEEFKNEIQTAESVLFFAYEHTVRRLCQDVVDGLTASGRLILWLGSEEYFDWDDESGVPHDSVVSEHVAEELYRRVVSRADDEPLVSADDEEGE
jgi:hypothetical protein